MFTYIFCSILAMWQIKIIVHKLTKHRRGNVFSLTEAKGCSYLCYPSCCLDQFVCCISCFIFLVLIQVYGSWLEFLQNVFYTSSCMALTVLEETEFRPADSFQLCVFHSVSVWAKITCSEQAFSQSAMAPSLTKWCRTASAHLSLWCICTCTCVVEMKELIPLFAFICHHCM